MALLLALPWLPSWTLGPQPAVPQSTLAMAVAGLALALVSITRRDQNPAPVAVVVFGWVLIQVFSPVRDFLAGAIVGGTAGAICIAGGIALGATFRQRPDHGSFAAMAWLLAAVMNAFAGWLQFVDGTDIFAGWISGATQSQIFGNLRQRNQFATLMNLGLVAVFLCHWRLGQSRRLLAATCVLLLTSANALSSSRIGALGLLLVCAVCWLWTSRHAVAVRLYIALAVATYAVVSAATYLQGLGGGDSRGVLGRLEEQTPDCHSRLTLWHNVLDLIAQRPWRGWGWGELDYAHFATLYPGTRFCAILDNAHNLPLHLAVELGVPVAVAFVAVCAFLVIRARPWRETEPARQLAWTVLAVVMLHSLVEYPLWYGPFQLTVGLAIGMLIARPAGTGVSYAVWPAHVQRLLGVLMAVVATYAAWDYWRVSQIYRPQALRAEAYREDTLNKISSSWLFRDPVRFARLTTQTVTPANAREMHALADAMLHFSPEPAVIERYIDGARLLGRDAEADWAEQRYAAAFAAEHARWQRATAGSR